MFEEMLKQSISGKEWGSRYVDEVLNDNCIKFKVEGDESTRNFKVTFFVCEYDKENGVETDKVVEQCTLSVKDNIIE